MQPLRAYTTSGSLALEGDTKETAPHRGSDTIDLIVSLADSPVTPYLVQLAAFTEPNQRSFVNLTERTTRHILTNLESETTHRATADGRIYTTNRTEIAEIKYDDIPLEFRLHTTENTPTALTFTAGAGNGEGFTCEFTPTQFNDFTQLLDAIVHDTSHPPLPDDPLIKPVNHT